MALGATRQWDFETYYLAAKAWRAGLNPYDLTALGTVAGRTIELPYLYPPVALLLFLPFTHLSLSTAGFLWLGLKCLIAASILWICWREFLRPCAAGTFLVVALLGFNLALLWDLRTGNASLIEGALLWAGFVAYVRRRFLIAALFIAMASIFKIYPVLFLGVLFAPPPIRRASARHALFGLAIFLFLVSMPVASHGAWIRALLDSLRLSTLNVDLNPSLLGWLDWILKIVRTPAAQANRIAPALYVVAAAALLWASGASLKRIYRGGGSREIVVTAVLLWLLLLPRVVVYSYAMAALPSVFALQTKVTHAAWRFGATWLLILQGLVRLLPGQPPFGVGAMSYPLILGIWLVWTHQREEPTRGNFESGTLSASPRAGLSA